MELKPAYTTTFVPSSALLIVPYGIETWNVCVRRFCRMQLLIVPYGIETDEAILLVPLRRSF